MYYIKGWLSLFCQHMLTNTNRTGSSGRQEWVTIALSTFIIWKLFYTAALPNVFCYCIKFNIDCPLNFSGVILGALERICLNGLYASSYTRLFLISAVYHRWETHWALPSTCSTLTVHFTSIMKTCSPDRPWCDKEWQGCGARGSRRAAHRTPCAGQSAVGALWWAPKCTRFSVTSSSPAERPLWHRCPTQTWKKTLIEAASVTGQSSHWAQLSTVSWRCMSGWVYRSMLSYPQLLISTTLTGV